MTVKVTVIYTKPDDATAFDKHYFDVHMPLARSIPGIQRAEVSKVAGDSPWHLIAELYFADQAALDAGFASDEGRAAGKDFGAIAPEGSSMTVSQLLD